MTKPNEESENVKWSYNNGYAAGLRDGEKRLARALRRWQIQNAPCSEDAPIPKETLDTLNRYFARFDKWLSARTKRGKK